MPEHSYTEQSVCGATWPENPELVCRRDLGYRGGHSYNDGPLPEQSVSESRNPAYVGLRIHLEALETIASGECSDLTHTASGTKIPLDTPERRLSILTGALSALIADVRKLEDQG